MRSKGLRAKSQRGAGASGRRAQPGGNLQALRRTATAVRSPRFERQLPDIRRQKLIDATIECLKRYGHEGLSIRRISAHANVSIGLINHHFPNKNELVAQAYQYFNSQLFEGLKAAAEQARSSPRARLDAFLQASFSPPNLDADVLAVWIVFWGLHRHSREIQRVHRDTYGGYVNLLRAMLSDLETDAKQSRTHIRLVAIGLSALLDGLWLEWCLDPKTFQPREAVSICKMWVDRALSSPAPPTNSA